MRQDIFKLICFFSYSIKTLTFTSKLLDTSSYSVQCCCPSSMCYVISYLYLGKAKRKAKCSHKIAHYIYSRHLPQQVISEVIIVSFKNRGFKLSVILRPRLLLLQECLTSTKRVTQYFYRTLTKVE